MASEIALGYCHGRPYVDDESGHDTMGFETFSDKLSETSSHKTLVVALVYSQQSDEDTLTLLTIDII